jgi:hypothetical protein
MCLDAEAKACSNKFRMLEAYKGKSLLKLRAHGLVGLSPAKDVRTPRFIDTLYDSGAIKKKVFSFFITKYYEAIAQGKDAEYVEDIAPGSKLIIGGYDLEKYADPKENGKIHWIKLRPDKDGDNYWWTVGIDKITLGGSDI